MYPEELVTPIRKELTDQGFEELLSANDVEARLNQDGTALVVINSVCGCAAAGARPAAIQSLQSDKTPDFRLTAFAGVDLEAVEKVREKHFPFAPSSPAIALFKNGKLVHMLERHHIEGNQVEDIVENLHHAYQQFC